MKTQREIEAAICEAVSRFEQDYMGRGLKDIRTHLLGDLLVVRLRAVLAAAEQHLVKSLTPEKVRDLLKQVPTLGHLESVLRSLGKGEQHVQSRPLKELSNPRIDAAQDDPAAGPQHMLSQSH